MAYVLNDWMSRLTGGGSVTTQPVAQPAPTTSTATKDYADISLSGGDVNARYDQWRAERDQYGWKPRMVDWYQREGESMLGQGETEARRLNNLEESRGQRMEDIIGAALPEASKATMNEQDIRRQFSRDADAAGGDMLSRMGALRSYLGGAGVTGGGMAAGMASQYNLARMGQTTDARRALFIEKSKADALDRARNFQNQLTFASAVNRPVSMLYSDYLGQAAGIRLGQSGVERQYMAADKAADAAKDAGKWSAIGSFGSGVLGIL
jgi:hypothetical protein